MSDEYDPMPSSRRPPKQTPKTIGNHKLNPATLMMGYGYDPTLSEGSLKAPIFLTSTFVFEKRGATGNASSKASPAKGPAAAPPRGWSIRASTGPTRKSSRTGCRSGRMRNRR